MRTVETIIQISMALIGAYAAALWFCLVVWTFRDAQAPGSPMQPPPDNSAPFKETPSTSCDPSQAPQP